MGSAPSAQLGYGVQIGEINGNLFEKVNAIAQKYELNFDMAGDMMSSFVISHFFFIKESIQGDSNYMPEDQDNSIDPSQMVVKDGWNDRLRKFCEEANTLDIQEKFQIKFAWYLCASYG